MRGKLLQSCMPDIVAQPVAIASATSASSHPQSSSISPAKGGRNMLPHTPTSDQKAAARGVFG